MNTQRLLEMAQHLESGVLRHKIFDFSQVNDTYDSQCGTLGCAMGELPVVYPKIWKYKSGMVYLIQDSSGFMGKDIRVWFDLSQEEKLHIFYPKQQRPEKYGGEHLNENATRYQIAENIRAFIQKLNG